MEELAKPAIEALKSGELKFVPERFDKIYLHWLENIKDWCISRQIWWGHRIPAYYCDECGEFVVDRHAPEKCPHCGCTHFTQDEDTLDTWFHQRSGRSLHSAGLIRRKILITSIRQTCL